MSDVMPPSCSRNGPGIPEEKLEKEHLKYGTVTTPVTCIISMMVPVSRSRYLHYGMDGIVAGMLLTQ